MITDPDRTTFNKAFSLVSAWLRHTGNMADLLQVANLTSIVKFCLENQDKTSDQLDSEYKIKKEES